MVCCIPRCMPPGPVPRGCTMQGPPPLGAWGSTSLLTRATKLHPCVGKLSQRNGSRRSTTYQVQCGTTSALSVPACHAPVHTIRHPRPVTRPCTMLCLCSGVSSVGLILKGDLNQARFDQFMGDLLQTRAQVAMQGLFTQHVLCAWQHTCSAWSWLNVCLFMPTGPPCSASCYVAYPSWSWLGLCRIFIAQRGSCPSRATTRNMCSRECTIR